jgi:hypothetical protein
VFKLVDNAITPRRALFEHALNRFPTAAAEAHHEAITHLHARVTTDLEEAGIDSGPVQVFHQRGRPYLGIAGTDAGDKLADIEYGTPDEPPNPVVRTTITKHRPSAQAVFSAHLWRGLGF